MAVNCERAKNSSSEIRDDLKNGASVIPFDQVIWDANECADYLRQSYSTFIKRTQYLPGFPARCQIPGQPRWPAMRVTQWALGNHEPITNEAESPSTA